MYGILYNYYNMNLVFSYLGGSLFGCLHKYPNVFPSPGFSAAAGILATEKHKATFILGTPTMFSGGILYYLKLENL